MARSNLLSTAVPFVLGVGALMALTGCEATVETEPVYYARQPVIVEEPGPVVWVEGPPVEDIEVYPVYVYGGTNVYFVGDRWYYRDGDRWAYYREEPRELYVYRERANVAIATPYNGSAGGGGGARVSANVSASAGASGGTPRSGAAPDHVGATAGMVHPTGPVSDNTTPHEAIHEEPHPSVSAQPSAARNAVANTAVANTSSAPSAPQSAPPSRPRPSHPITRASSRSKKR